VIRNFRMMVRRAVAAGPKTVAVIAPQESSSIEAIEQACRMGLARGVLIGHRALIEQMLRQAGADPAGHEIIDERDMDRAAGRGAEMAAAGEVDILLKGGISTNRLLHAILKGPRSLRTGRLMSDVALFEDRREGVRKIVMISDGGVNVAPDLKEKICIIRNAVAVAHALGIRVPRVAILSGVEKVQPEVRSTVDALALAKICSYGEVPGCVVDGPFALDNAISPEAAKIKKVESPVAGAADILIMPDLEAGNIFGKSLVYYAGKDLAHVIVGARVPILISSRSDPPAARLASIALGVLMTEEARKREGEEKP
jgi:phosphate butyryltransferase